MAGGSSYPIEVQEEARKRVLAGEGVRAVARDMGLQPMTVSRWCRLDRLDGSRLPAGRPGRTSSRSRPSLPTPVPVLPGTPPPRGLGVVTPEDVTWADVPKSGKASPSPPGVAVAVQVNPPLMSAPMCTPRKDGPVWHPSGEGAVDDALTINQAESPDAWVALGKAYPAPGMSASRSAVVFGCVCTGMPVGVAAQRAGYAPAEPEVWRSRARDGGQWGDWWTALNMASAWAMGNLCARVIGGMAGWQGAARQLIAIAPEVFNIKDGVAGAITSSVDGLDNATLISIVQHQMLREEGKRPEVIVAEDVMPLSETGMEGTEDAG